MNNDNISLPDNYNVEKRIGAGAYGEVFSIKDKNTGKYLAAKVITDEEYDRFGIDNIVEIDILTRLIQANLMHADNILVPNLDNVDNLTFLMPLANRTLFNVIDTVDLNTVYFILFKILKSIHFLHTVNYLHLDIKPDNIVMQDEEPLVTDFGLSIYNNNEVDYRRRGTRNYRAPELHHEAPYLYNEASDVWSLGILFYRALAREKIWKISWDNIDRYDFDKMVNNIHLSITRDNIKNLLIFQDPNMVNVIIRMLDWNPATRATIKEILDSPVFAPFQNIKIDESIIYPEAGPELPPNNREYIKHIMNFCNELVPDESIEFLFLVIDLYNRAITEKESDLFILIATSIWVASKILLNNRIISRGSIIKLLQDFVPNLTGKHFIMFEKYIIHATEGIVNSNVLFNICNTEEEIKYTLVNIILNDDPNVYNTVLIDEWIEILQEMNLPKSNKKIKISDVIGY